MKIIVDGNKFKISKITGPAHNYLSLQLYEGSEHHDFILICMDKIENKSKSIHEDNIKDQIIKGLLEINNELSSNYRVIEAEYLENDTYSENIYIDLTKAIVNEVHTRGLIKT